MFIRRPFFPSSKNIVLSKKGRAICRSTDLPFRDGTSASFLPSFLPPFLLRSMASRSVRSSSILRFVRCFARWKESALPRSRTRIGPNLVFGTLVIGSIGSRFTYRIRFKKQPPCISANSNVLVFFFPIYNLKRISFVSYSQTCCFDDVTKLARINSSSNVSFSIFTTKRARNAFYDFSIFENLSIRFEIDRIVKLNGTRQQRYLNKIFQ